MFGPNIYGGISVRFVGEVIEFFLESICELDIT